VTTVFVNDKQLFKTRVNSKDNFYKDYDVDMESVNKIIEKKARTKNGITVQFMGTSENPFVNLYFNREIVRW